MKNTYTKVVENSTYRLIQVPVTSLNTPFRIQRKFFGIWITIHRDYYQERAELNFDIYANHAKKKIIKSI